MIIARKISRVLLLAILLMPLCSTSVLAQHDATVDRLIADAERTYTDADYEETLVLLDRVLKLEESNAWAHFYKGLAYLSQKKPELALKSLQAARDHDDKNDIHFRYQLGQVYFLLENYDQAWPLLSGVYEEQPTLENVGYYVGVLQYRRRAYSDALKTFSQVQTMDPNKNDYVRQMRPLVGYYKGLTLGHLAISDRTPQEIDRVVKELDDLSKIQNSQAFDSQPFSESLARLRATLTSPQSPEKRFNASLSVGGFYSDNVALNPNRSGDAFAESLRARSTTSPGLVMSASGEYAWLRTGPWESTVSYNFFQTVNLNDGLSRFNIQDHQVKGAGYYRGTFKAMPYKVGITYAYDYLFLGQNGFLSRHTPTLSGTLMESDYQMTTALFQFQDKTFFREADFTGRFPALQRDAMNWMGGFIHTFRFKEDRHFLGLGYQYDVEDATGSDFSYSGHRLLVRGLFSLPWPTTPWGATRLRYEYQVHWRDYRSLNVTFPQVAPNTIRRDDAEQHHFVRLEQPLPNNFTVSFLYQRIQNDSNLAVYDYTQNSFYVLTTWEKELPGFW